MAISKPTIFGCACVFLYLALLLNAENVEGSGDIGGGDIGGGDFGEGDIGGGDIGGGDIGGGDSGGGDIEGGDIGGGDIGGGDIGGGDIGGGDNGGGDIEGGDIGGGDIGGGDIGGGDIGGGDIGGDGGDFSSKDGWQIEAGDDAAWTEIPVDEGNDIGEEGGALHECLLPKKTGPCKANKKRWYFDNDHGDCKSFTYGGCKANQNNFASKAECRKTCDGFLMLDPCVCVAASHYLTFDQVKIDHLGKCKYTLTRSVDWKDKCAFEVQVKKYPEKGSKKLSWVRLLDLKFNGHVIRMGPGDILKIDGVDRDIPVTSIPGLRIACYGKWLEARADNCGFSVLFDMESTAKISLDRLKWDSKVFGMCGNCDDDKSNDWNVREGYSVSNRKHKVELVGDSYLVPDDSDKPAKNCHGEFYHPKCPDFINKLIGHKYYCGQIKNVDGHFSECIQSGTVDYMTFYRMCGFDVCEMRRKKEYKYMKIAICRALTYFADVCRDHGFNPTVWRSKSFCFQKCKKNMWFNPLASGCPNTCSDMTASEHCDKPTTEACVCNEGFYLDGPNKCVKENHCGCVTKEGDYYKLGAEWLGEECKTVRLCIKKKGKAVIEERATSCDEVAHCDVRKGKRQCVCNWPYVGNGLVCHRECPDFKCYKTCKYGFRKACGCLVCMCNKCPPLACEKKCLFGYYRDDHGCQHCSCNRLCAQPHCDKRCPKGRIWKRKIKEHCWHCECHKGGD